MPDEEPQQRQPWASAGGVLAPLALVGSVALVGHGVLMQVHFSPTTQALEEASTGRWVFACGAIAAVIAGAALSVLRRFRLPLAVIALLAIPTVEVWAAKNTAPDPVSVTAVESFQPPASFRAGSVSSDPGRTLVRRWKIDPATDAPTACRQFEDAFREWADPGSVTLDADNSCFLTGTRKGVGIEGFIAATESGLNPQLRYNATE